MTGSGVPNVPGFRRFRKLCAEWSPGSRWSPGSSDPGYRRAVALALGTLFLTGAVASQTAPAKPVLVVFETELGNITMEIDVVHAPITGENFLKYVDGKFYDGGVINRAVRPDNTIRHDV